MFDFPTDEPAVVTCGLPYANGELHIGHLRTYVAGDFLSRALKLCGQKTAFVCGSDMHGTPIAVNAAQDGVGPSEFAQRWHKEYQSLFPAFDIEFDNYGHTDDPTNHELTRRIVEEIDENGYTYVDTIKVAQDTVTDQPLPDRYVKGACPHCGEQARGDECDQGCGRHLEPGEIEDPSSTLTNNPAEYVEREHKFFRLTEFKDHLTDFLDSLEGTTNAKQQPREWLDDLRDWCITRDLDWGVSYPGRDDLVLYVWVDAPIEYISSTKQYSERVGEQEYDWRDVWQGDGEILHVIGRDIIQHHTIFWPALLKAVDYNQPRAVVASGFVNQEGEALSTSRGNTITLNDYRQSELPTDYLRFFLLTASSFETDVDFTVDAFRQRVNDELVDKIGNFIHRISSFADAHYDSFDGPVDEAVQDRIRRAKDTFVDALNHYQIRKLGTTGVRLAAYGNEYLQENEPWKTIDSNPDEARRTVHSTLQIAKAVSIFLQPLIPDSARAFQTALGEPSAQSLQAVTEPPVYQGANPEAPFDRIDTVNL